MPNHEMVMVAFLRVAVAGYIVVMVFVKIRILSASKHLVWVGLMGYIKHEFILRRFKYIVQRNRCFYHTEVWTEMSAVDARTLQERLTHFRR